MKLPGGMGLDMMQLSNDPVSTSWLVYLTEQAAANSSIHLFGQHILSHNSVEVWRANNYF